MTRWRPQPAPDLPDGLVLFDGVCVTCSWWIRFRVERDPDGRYRVVTARDGLG